MKIHMIVTYKAEEYGEALDVWVETNTYYGSELGMGCICVVENRPDIENNPSVEIQQAADVLVILKEVQ